MVAVTNYHKLNFVTTERHSFIAVEARSLKAEQNQDVSKALTPFRVWGECTPWILQFLVAAQHSLFYGHITPVFKAHIFKPLSAPSSHHFLCVWYLPLSPSYKDTCDCIRAHLDNPG